MMISATLMGKWY